MIYDIENPFASRVFGHIWKRAFDKKENKAKVNEKNSETAEVT